MAATYSMDEVRKHSKADDLWMVLHNKVYNVTKYLDDHPGGPDIMIEVGGTDATEAFEEIGHSDDAREAMQPFYIGDLATEEHAEEVEVYRATYEKVSTVPVINPVKLNKSKALARLAKFLARASLVGAVVYGVYKNGFGMPTSLIHRDLLKLQTGNSAGQFWRGFALAGVGDAIFSIGLAAWAWQKLDVQQEFTHYPAYRPNKKEATVLKKKDVKLIRRAPVLDPQKYRKFPLVRKDQLSSNTYRFVFGLPRETDVLGLPIGQHIAIRADINGKSVARSYTPTSNDVDKGRIELVIKVYPGGLITNYLANLNVGDEVEIRGPKGAMTYNNTYSKHILMIAGGTGITPMYQLIRAICSDDNDNTSVSLLYANNTEEDILLKEELDAFAAKCPQKFGVHYVLAKANESWKGGVGFITQEMIREHGPPVSKDVKALLCGPPPMINAMKKNLGALGFELPTGALSKVTDQVFLF
ncbi:hypothetical protein AJ79_00576 [Helicocarpus griseus UAMH5409]|uniref:NADH-cytochrome b5 reductase 1 n=1 Tax=Helicocarpus griseus UAMH5409 TaxID=1447875 RepID=A0A2B7YCB9_9EURO|nr:hypothetical protein AJ79_00576 [Helicocarpus griseus UAMH5409]